MSAKKINTRIQQKRDKAANWETAGLNGFIPLAGEIIIYDEGDGSAPKFKVGDGVVQADGKTISGTNINNLPFANVTPAELEEMGYVFDTVIQKIYDEDYTEEAEDLKSIREIAEEVAVNKADKTEGIIFVTGSGTTDATAKTSTWVGTSDRISSYYDGLAIRYKVGVAGQSTTTLNINGLGAKTIYRFNDTKLTTQFPVGSIIQLVYHADLNGGCWMCNDYDANTDTKVNVYRQVTTTSSYNKDYPLLVSRTVAADIATKGTNGSKEAVYAVMNNDETKVPTLNPHTGDMHIRGGFVVDGTFSANAKDLGSMNGKTIADLRTALSNWLKDNTYNYYAVARFNSSNFVSLWNANDLTTPLASRSEYVVRIASTYYQESYAQLEITSYWDKEVYYVARVNSEWKPMRQVAFKDDIETYVNEAILGGEW